MDKLIKWLFLKTADGATYFQAIIILILIGWLVLIGVKTSREIWKAVPMND